ncbi:uncharacterized protein BDR25DRAFT_301108 [Lindgomyces ingoldianus]|uniref:Uncharacterized protein n=1 Tax=Lindgomyces ingoldianus TaxID=673940 RepID=A0ACB6R800_9PLEO|nr:uncharacterized protein BDR25DRAFT_301108 [Lindgomyces ingoldianus]KAF2475444.1 hypothetical protein BDR25DRAFT_301108 [Lindgomyces ingoldianus]
MSRQASTTAHPAAQVPWLHQYACKRCRMRKVKCDKVLPACALCIESSVQCTYLARRPRNSQKVHPEPAPQRRLLPAERTAHDAREASPGPKHTLDSRDESRSDDEDDLVIPREMRDSKFEARFDSGPEDHGRLFVAQGKSRYINSDKANQVADLESVLAADSSAKDEGASSQCLPSARPKPKLEYSSLLGTSHIMQSLRTYHPPPEVMNTLWKYYVLNVDILVKILYKPTVETFVISASRDLEGLSPSSEVLLFAIWFATITTMPAEECLKLHKEEKSTLLKKYRYALEQALAQAGWMTTQEVVVLQALILFIVCTPWNNTRSTWMVSGIALSVAQAMGMHSDSSSFSLGAIETEVRRRVWWYLCQLDIRISEDCGLEPHVPLAMDTRYPLHINDSDLNEGNTETVAPRTEFTEMTASLVKIEMADTILKVKRCRYRNPPLNSSEIETLSRDQIRRYEETYLTYPNENSHLHYLLYRGMRLLIAKLWKIKYDASQQNDEVEQGGINEPLLFYNADVLEITHQFPDDVRQFGWFFRCRDTKWHAIAYLLIELCKHTRGPAVDRAWAVLDVVFSDWGHDSSEDAGSLPGAQKEKKSAILQPLLKLVKRARHARKQALEASQGSRGELSDAPSTFDSGYENTGLNPVEEHTQSAPHEDGLLGDPFLFSGTEFGDEMNWEQLDTWIQSFQPELSSQQESMDFQTHSHTGVLSWW